MAGLLRQRMCVLVTVASSVVLMMMTMLQVVSGKSLAVDCTSQHHLRHTWRHPCRGSTELSIAPSDEAATEAATEATVESIKQQLRLLKQDSASVKHRAMKLKNRYVSKSLRIDGLTAAFIEEQYAKSQEFPDLQPLTLIEVSCSSTTSDDHEKQKQRKRGKDIHFQQKLNEIVSRSVEVLSFSSLLLQRAIIHEECNEPDPLSESFMRIQHDVDTMLCRVHQIVYPRSIDSLLSNDTLQALERTSNSYEQLLDDSLNSIPRNWVDYLLLRDIVNSMRVLKHLYSNLIDYNCKTAPISQPRHV